MDQSNGAAETSRKQRVNNICLITLCMGFQTVATAGIALFMPIIRRDLGISFTQGGSLSAATYAGYALMQIPGGYLSDRYGIKKIFLTGVLGSTLLCFAFGMVNDYWHAVFIQASAGFFNALIFTSGLALLGAWFGPQRRATAMALSLIGIFLGYLMINIFGPSLEKLYSWRFPFMGFASVGIAASLIYAFFGKVPLRQRSGGVVRPLEVFRLFRHRFMWVCGAIQYIRLGVVQGLNFWLPSLLIDEKGLSLQTAGLIIAFRSFLVAPTNIIGGYMSDRLKKPIEIIGVSLLALAVTSTLIARTDHRGPLIFLIILNALFLQLYFGPLFAMPIERYGTRMMGSLSGFGNFFANLGGITFSFLLGWMKDRSGLFEPGFYTLSGACLIGIGFTILLAKMRRGSPTVNS